MAAVSTATDAPLVAPAASIPTPTSVAGSRAALVIGASIVVEMGQQQPVLCALELTKWVRLAMGVAK